MEVRCRDGIARGLPFTDAVATQAGTLSQVFARQPHEHARGMELRTGKSNHRHEKIVRALAIAHNVNNSHQAADA